MTAALERWRKQLAREIDRYRIEQYFFYSQFDALRHGCKDRGILIMGDLPIYVAHDSADVWADRHDFKLREDGRPLVQAGVPPDYFSATGQLWGNPDLRLERDARRRLRLVDPTSARGVRAVRHRSHRSLPRLRGVLGSPG